MWMYGECILSWTENQFSCFYFSTWWGHGVLNRDSRVILMQAVILFLGDSHTFFMHKEYERVVQEKDALPLHCSPIESVRQLVFLPEIFTKTFHPAFLESLPFLHLWKHKAYYNFSQKITAFLFFPSPPPLSLRFASSWKIFLLQPIASPIPLPGCSSCFPFKMFSRLNDFQGCQELVTERGQTLF